MWRNWVKKGSKFEPEKDRYHLYVACEYILFEGAYLLMIITIHYNNLFK